MEDKDFILRFNARVREIDRKYEKLNNQDFDNGVYHKFAYKQHVKAGQENLNVPEQNKDGPTELNKNTSQKTLN